MPGHGLTRRSLSPRNPPADAGDEIQRGVLAVSLVLIVAVVTVSVLLALTSHNTGVGITAFVLFAAAMAIGAGLGFLFGLPRSRVSDMAPDGTGPGSAGVLGGKPSTYYLTNSNLIKVSDWLTTIVIGLGLVNLGKVVPAFRNLASALRQPLGGTAYAGTLGVSALIFGLLAGFLLCYLWISIRMRQLLEEAERENQNTVPQLSDISLGEAKVVAERHNIKLIVPDRAPDDSMVIGQALPPGTPVPPGTALTLTMVAPASWARASMPPASTPSNSNPPAMRRRSWPRRRWRTVPERQGPSNGSELEF